MFKLYDLYILYDIEIAFVGDRRGGEAQHLPVNVVGSMIRRMDYLISVIFAQVTRGTKLY